jgi:hypothetical protein
MNEPLPVMPTQVSRFEPRLDAGIATGPGADGRIWLDTQI